MKFYRRIETLCRVEQALKTACRNRAKRPVNAHFRQLRVPIGPIRPIALLPGAIYAR